MSAKQPTPMPPGTIKPNPPPAPPKKQSCCDCSAVTSELAALRSAHEALKKEGAEFSQQLCALVSDKDAELTALKAERDALKTAVSAFLDKYELVRPAIESAFQMSQIHGMPYRGPNFGDELTALKALRAYPGQKP